jgi:L-asparaginase
MPLPKILMVSLGGTITMTQSSGGGITPTLSAVDLVRSVPAIVDVAELETASPMRLPGPSLPLEGLVELAATLERRLASDLDGAVVIQGTDTIEETAWLLDLLVRSEKPVVVTGAMRGPDFPGADGPANLLASAIVAASQQARGRGCLVVLNDEVHAARFVRKSHTSLPSAFTSPMLGPVGLVAERQVVFLASTARTPAIPQPGPQVSACEPAPASAPAAGPARAAAPISAATSKHATTAESAVTLTPAPVALLRMALGDDGRLLPALPALGYRGAVLEGMGAGHVPAAVAPLVGELVEQLPVVLATRVPAGSVFTRTYGYPGAEIDLVARGVLPCGTLGGLKARILLSLLLGCGLDRHELEERFKAVAS